MFRGSWSSYTRSSGRRFEKGDLKYVILNLLKEKSRHGYEIMRALEDRVGGFYNASPGTIYPTLQMLEDLGYVTSTQLDGKRVYTITEEGLHFLDEREDVVDGIWERMSEWWDPAFKDAFKSMQHELGDLARVFFRGTRMLRKDPQRLQRVRDVIARACREIEAIISEETV